MADIRSELLPEAFKPLFDAFIAETFSPRGKVMPWFKIMVAVPAHEMEKALAEAQRLAVANQEPAA